MDDSREKLEHAKAELRSASLDPQLPADQFETGYRLPDRVMAETHRIALAKTTEQLDLDKKILTQEREQFLAQKKLYDEQHAIRIERTKSDRAELERLTSEVKARQQELARKEADYARQLSELAAKESRLAAMTNALQKKETDSQHKFDSRMNELQEMERSLSLESPDAEGSTRTSVLELEQQRLELDDEREAVQRMKNLLETQRAELEKEMTEMMASKQEVQDHLSNVTKLSAEYERKLELVSVREAETEEQAVRFSKLNEELEAREPDVA